MESRFFRFVWRHSRWDQIIILFLTVLTFPLVLFSLELPKEIINEAIEGRDFPKVWFGVEFEQVPYLLALSGLFLLMVILINALKWLMNVRVGMAGERMLRRMRFLLFERVMLFRIGRFRSSKPGEIIQSILGEIEPLGGFFGEVIATPAFQGGLLVVYTTFIFLQDVVLGLAAVALLPVQAYIVPKLQAKIVRLNKERAQNTRLLADKIGESVHVIAEIHTNDTARWHLAQVAGRLYENTVIRLQLFKRKFTIKFINNFINQLTPFFFYSVGGYLVIKGRLDLGSLMAVLVAYKEVAAPWKAVLNYWQRWTDFNSRYVFVVENFSGEDVLEPRRIYAEPADAAPLSGPLEYTVVEGGPGTGGLIVPRLTIEPGEMIAVTGGSAGARETLLRLAAGLAAPLSGRVLLGGRVLVDCTLPQVGAAVAYIGAEPGIVSRSMRENLLYGLLRGAPDLAENKDAALADMLSEAKLTGNTTAHPEGDWVLYEAAAVPDRATLEARLLELTELVGLSGELYSNALEQRLDPARAEEWTGLIRTARAKLQSSDADLSGLVEPWSVERFNSNATLMENLLFALPVCGTNGVAELVERPEIADLLRETGGGGELLRIGWTIATEFSELVDALEADSAVFDSFDGYSRGDIVAASQLVADQGAKGTEGIRSEGRRLLRRLAAGYIEARDRLDVLDKDGIGRLLDCRAKARKRICDDPDYVCFDEDRFSPAQTVAENILNAKRRQDRKSAWKTLDALMRDAIDEAGLTDTLIELGLDAAVSASGLSASTRRRVALVRALIKRPKLLLLDGMAGSDNEADHALRRAIRVALPNATILYAALEEAAIVEADRVIRISESGLADVEPVTS